MKKIISRRNVIVFIIIVGLAVVFWSSSLLQSYYQEAAIFLQEYGALHPYVSIFIFIGLSALSAMIFSFSSVWLVPVAVTLWQNSFTIILLLASWLLGAIISYLIGYYGGYPIAAKIVKTDRLSYYQKLISERLGFWIIFLFRLTLPSEIPGYLLGIFRYPFFKYLLVTLLAELPYAIYSVYAIDSIINKEPKIVALATFIWIIAALILTYFYQKRINHNNSLRK